VANDPDASKSTYNNIVVIVVVVVGCGGCLESRTKIHKEGGQSEWTPETPMKTITAKKSRRKRRSRSSRKTTITQE
jgi:hypothetical protein